LKRRMEELALRVVGKGPKIGEKSPPLISFDKSLSVDFVSDVYANDAVKIRIMKLRITGKNRFHSPK